MDRPESSVEVGAIAYNTAHYRPPSNRAYNHHLGIQPKLYRHKPVTVFLINSEMNNASVT